MHDRTTARPDASAQNANVRCTAELDVDDIAADVHLQNLALYLDGS